MSSRPFASARLAHSLILCALVCLLTVTGSAQLKEYTSLKQAGIPMPASHAFPVLPPDPPSTIPPSERPQTPTEAEEAWTPSPYRVSGYTYFVSNTDNSGTGSLRQAILDANDNPGQDLISFAIPASGVQSIRLTSVLPRISDPVIIDGATQSGYSGTPIIELDGSGTGSGHNGLVITCGGSIVRGLVINRFLANGPNNGMGIVLDSAGGNIIEGCYIGLNAGGTTALGNGGSGIAIFGASSHNLIGGAATAKRNVISGNGMSGIQISTGSTGGNRIINNLIGLNAAGDTSRGNFGNGIFVDAPDDTIGGTAALTRNVISGNRDPGIALATAAQRTLIQGNYFGTDWGYHYYGLGNAFNAIAIVGGSYNTIGGTSKAARNLIQASNQAGILIEGVTATGNVVQGNYVCSNDGNYLETQNVIGIWVRDAPGNTIGGTADSAGNLITFSSMHGIEISGANGTGNIVQGNRIGGYDRTLTGYGNARYGLVIDDAPGNSIGGINTSNAPNVIQGNGAGGIIIIGPLAIGNIVKGNYIGPDINHGKGNGFQPDGIILAASNNMIGGIDLNEGNVIAFNRRCGIFDSTGTGNYFVRNVIHSNDSLGIDLAPRGITPNDPLDADAGANGLQNFPILDSADIGTASIRIRGRMSGIPNTSYTLHFYTNASWHPLHFGQGNSYFGSGSVLCDGMGNGDINVTIPGVYSTSDIITATATGPDLSTSEFSRAICMLDTDGDGILDIWETPGNGIDWNCDGLIDLDLIAMGKGINKNHKDLLVEVDYMSSHKPDLQSLKNVQTAFQSVPNRYLNNPDGNNGINLVVDFENMHTPIPDAKWADPPWPEFFAAKRLSVGLDADWGSTNYFNIKEAKGLVYRYCIFIDTFGPVGYTGLTRIGNPWGPTNDFLVALGTMQAIPGKKVMFESSTFMHELGHSLGLMHGGGDHDNYKPNFYSIMNYLYLWDIQDPPAGDVIPLHTWMLDYSPAPLATLYENTLDEMHGLAPSSLDFPNVVEIPFSRKGTIARALLRPVTSVDWDGNGDSTGFAAEAIDVNIFPPLTGASPGGVLHSWGDWSNLAYSFRCNPMYQIRDAPPSTVGRFQLSGTKDATNTEITLEDYLELRKFPPYGVIDRKGRWSESSLENIPIATTTRGNHYPRITTDGHRGAIISWNHSELADSPVYDRRGVYAQRLDSLGQSHWQNNGVWISPGRLAGGNHAITTDGEGGAIIAWMAQVNPGAPAGPYNLYAQRIDANGDILWGAAGVDISTDGTWYGGEPMIASDGRGGAIIAWGTTTGSIYAQRVNGSGNALWRAGGVFVGSFTYPYAWWGDAGSALAHDPQGGSVILWQAGSSSTSVHAQRIDTSGSIRWGANGILISATGGGPFVIPAGGGQTYVAWADTRTGTQAIYAQRLDTAGAFLWGATGLPVDVSSKSKFSPRLIPDGNGGVIASWFDYRHYPPLVGVYGQRITGAGTMVWPSTSVCFTDSASDASGELASVSDLKGGTILIYPSRMRSSRPDIFAQHIDSAGTPRWSGNGVAISSADYNQTFAVAISDGVGGAITAWMDERRAQMIDGPVACVFAQLINRDGGLGGTLVTGVAEGPSAVPESFRLFQNYPNPFNPSTTIEYDLPMQSKVVLRVYDILGRLVQELKNGIEPAGHARLVWSPQNRLASGVYFCRIEVAGTSGGPATQTRVVKMLLIR